MDFEFKTTIEGEDIILKFRPYGDAPGRISRHNINNMEAQIWAYLEWGLQEPENWPLDSTVAGYNIFDVMPQRQITECYQQWQNSDMGS
jgi:hypothetical protein